MQLSNSSKGLILAILSATCAGLSFAMTKGALNALSPQILLVIEAIASVTFLWIMILWQGIQIPLRWSSLKIGCLGLLEPGLSYVVMMQGLALTSASSATFISATEPALTIALAFLILREYINAPQILLTLLSCIGVALVASPDGTGSTQGSLLGDLLVFLGVAIASLYGIVTYRSLRLTRDLSPIAIAVVQQSVALIFFLVITIGVSAPIDFANPFLKVLIHLSPEILNDEGYLKRLEVLLRRSCQRI
ncbi:MAG: DMT family transporter [Hydrococcus sp. Prado102]|nr:DMT family transporter [Hydrococcus sp. Prado102]